MRRTNTYGLATHEPGDFWYAVPESQSFLTLDYHFNTYIGIIGNGVIKGWDIEPVAGLMVRVASGSGFIRGFYSETPYATDAVTGEPMRKSAARAAGYEIAEEIPTWSSKHGSWKGAFFEDGGEPDVNAKVLKQLGPDGEDANHDGKVEGVLQPFYESGDFDSDPYVKAASPSSTHFVLPDNADTYLFAERISEDPYETFVRFVTSQAFLMNSNRVCLAMVTTRQGTIAKIDTSLSFRLSGMASTITQIGRDLVNSHQHGGSKRTDPPRIKLKTDVRSCVPIYKNDSGEVTYQALPQTRTNSSSGHAHTTRLDADGNGCTVEVVGDVEFHYHDIVAWETTSTNTVYGSTTVVAHSHTMDKESKVWTTDSRLRVFVNGSEVPSSDYETNAADGMIRFKKGVANVSLPVYSSTFFVDTREKETYSFEMETLSFTTFVTKMQGDYWIKNKDKINGVGVMTQEDASLPVWDSSKGDYVAVHYTKTQFAMGGELRRSPFDFYCTSDFSQDVEVDEKGRHHYIAYVPVWVPLEESTVSRALVRQQAMAYADIIAEENLNMREYKESLKRQSLMAKSQLVNAGDVFTLMPTVGKYIPVTLKREAYADKVTVEILNDVEVSGILRPDNVYFVRAEKFIDGTFEPARIPFINHLGRIGERFAPRTCGTVTRNGIEYVPSTYQTSVSSGHAHRTYVDTNGNGVTTAVLVNDKLAVWKYDANGMATRIVHAHAIADDAVAPVVSDGINLWAGQDSQTEHSHEVEAVLHGLATCVYAVAADEDGNVIASTSDGVIGISAEASYRVTIDTHSYEYYGASLGEALSLAAVRYSNDTGIVFALDDVASQVPLATSSLSATWSRYPFGGDPGMTVTRIPYAKFDNLYAEYVRPSNAIPAGEVVVRPIDNDFDKSILEIAQLDAIAGEYMLTRSYYERPFWQIVPAGDTLHLVSYQGVLVGSQRTGWRQANMPARASICRRVVLAGAQWGPTDALSSSSSSEDAGTRMFAATDRMVCVSRNGGMAYHAFTPLPDANAVDMASSGDGWILVATTTGVYRISEADEHVELSLPAGNVVCVANDEGLASARRTYCLTSDRNVYVSDDSGSSWALFRPIDTSLGELGRLFPCFGNHYVAAHDGLYTFGGDAHEKASTAVFRCSCWDNGRLILGGDNIISASDDGDTFATLHAFVGTPIPRFYVDSMQRAFGWAYLYGKGAAFEVPPTTSQVITAATSFDKWVAAGNGWDSKAAYEITMDGRKVLSTKTGTDDRATLVGRHFSVNVLAGVLDFTVSTVLTAKADKGDSAIAVESTVNMNGRLTVVVSGGGRRCYANAVGIGSQTITLDRPLPASFEVGAAVRMLSTMDGDVDVSGNVYESGLASVGTNSHEETEDALSMAANGLPLAMSKTYLGNLSETIVAAKRGLPNVDDGMVNWQTYLMDYSPDPMDDDYVGKYVDMQSTLASRGSIFMGSNPAFSSNSVRCLAIGYGDLDGMAFVGTDAGLFYSQSATNLGRPWFWASECPAKDVVGVLVVGGASILVAGSNGIYKSVNNDLGRWRPVVPSGMATAMTFMGLRWGGSAGTHWWNSWNGTVNAANPNLSNTIIAGGTGQLMKSDDDGETWGNVPLSASSGYVVSCMAPLADGAAVLGVNGSGGDSKLFIDHGGGDSWDEMATFPNVVGTVTAVAENASGNTELTLELSQPSSKSLKDHSMIGSVASVGTAKFVVAANRDQAVVIQGKQASKVKTGAVLTVAPPNVSSVAESNDLRLYVGTGAGVWCDDGTRHGGSSIGGIINAVDRAVVVTGIDIAGQVAGAVVSADKTSLTCLLDRSVRAGELVGKRVVMTEGTSQAVLVSSPLPGSTVDSGSVLVRVSTVSFDVGVSGYVAVTLDDRDTVYASSSVIELTEVPEGKHKLTVSLVGLDRKPISGTLATRTLSFNAGASALAPSISVTFPANQQSVGTGTFNVTGSVANFNANGGDGWLTFARDGDTASRVVMQTSTSFSVPVSGMTDGQHTVRLALVDLAGNETGVATLVTFSVRLTTDPYIGITSPVNGSTVATNYAEIRYAVSNFVVPDEGRVLVSIDGKTAATSDSPTSTIITGIEDGSHTVTVTLVDAGLHPIQTAYGTSSVSIVVSAGSMSSPIVVVTSPTDGASYPAGTARVDVLFDTTNFSIPDDGGVVIGVNGTETYVTVPDAYVVPISGNGTYAVTLTLARSPSEKLGSAGASASISFSVGTDSARGVKAATSSAPQANVPTTRTTVSPTRATDDSSSSSQEDVEGYLVTANGTSAASGETSITLGTAVAGTGGRSFRLVGDNAVVYFSSTYPVFPGEFAGGQAYVSYSETRNQGTAYEITSNTANSLVVVGKIPPQSDTAVLVGQTMMLMPAGDKHVAQVTFDDTWEHNALADEMVAIDHANGGRSYGVVLSNTTRQMSVVGIDMSMFTGGDRFFFMTPVFTPVRGLRWTATSNDLDHSHEVATIPRHISGKIADLRLDTSAYVAITVSEADGLDDALIAADDTLLRGVTIVMYSPDGDMSYPQSVWLATPTHIVVSAARPAEWNLDGTKSGGIDKTWGWEIVAPACGMTIATHYDGFITSSTRLSQDAVNGTTVVSVAETTGIVAGSVVELFDSNGSSQLATVVSVSDGTVQIDEPAARTYAVAWGASLRVRADAFAGGHVHVVRNGEVVGVSNAAIAAMGYPSYHNHVLDGTIHAVSCVLADASNKVFVGGGSGKVYSSSNGGEDWGTEVDLDVVAPPSEEATSDTTVAFMAKDGDDRLVVGTGERLVFQSGTKDDSAVGMDVPVVEESSSSSSESSSSVSSASTSSSTSRSSKSSLNSSSSLSNSPSSVSSASSQSSTLSMSSLMSVL